VTKHLICLLGVLMAAGQLPAATNLAVAPTNSPPAAAPGAVDPVEKEYKLIMEADDAAQAEVDQWIRDNDAAVAKGAGVPSADLKRRIRDRFAPMRTAYEDFIQRHPDHARARVAYGSFLNDLQDEEGAQEQWEKARRMASPWPVGHFLSDPKRNAFWFIGGDAGKTMDLYRYDVATADDAARLGKNSFA